MAQRTGLKNELDKSASGIILTGLEGRGSLYVLCRASLSLCNAAAIFIFVVLYDFVCCVRTCGEIIHVGNFESHMQIANLSVPWNIARDHRNLFCRLCVWKVNSVFKMLRSDSQVFANCSMRSQYAHVTESSLTSL
jgi:hypothetical protein